jgi:predicted RNA-binding protein with PUA-like domain
MAECATYPLNCHFIIASSNKICTMAYWLVKSEPFKYSWDQFVIDKKTFWDGVRNYGARNNLRAMQKGDEVLFYHSNEGVEIVGIAKVVKESYQDPTTEETAWLVVDLKPVRKLKNAVSLDKVKKDPRLANMDLVRLGRLSVQTVKQEEWEIIMELSEEK